MALCWISYRQTHKGKSATNNTAVLQSMNLFFLSFSVFPHPPFPLLPLDERQALPQTEISPVIFTEAHSRWGKNVTDIIKWKRGRIQASLLAEKIYTSFPPFCFICLFLFVQLLSEDRDLLWTASEDVWEDVFFFFLRQGPQHDQWKWLGFIWCLFFCFLFCCLNCWGLAYQIKITSIQCSPEGVCERVSYSC